ncbi:ankyrin repeat-containing domain protein [Hypoxylon sp. NC1633]|nr:ankyrin repeat-containing domain protein [Hypoxylon sp. NC1633]
MEVLLSHGANINAISKHGWISFMLATKCNDEACTGFLLDHGADVNNLSPDRRAALVEATSRGYIGNLDVVAMLVDAGANTEPKSPLFKTALEIARENG